MTKSTSGGCDQFGHLPTRLSQNCELHCANVDRLKTNYSIDDDDDDDDDDDGDDDDDDVEVEEEDDDDDDVEDDDLGSLIFSVYNNL